MDILLVNIAMCVAFILAFRNNKIEFLGRNLIDKKYQI